MAASGAIDALCAIKSWAGPKDRSHLFDNFNARAGQGRRKMGTTDERVDIGIFELLVRSSWHNHVTRQHRYQARTFCTFRFTLSLFTRLLVSIHLQLCSWTPQHNSPGVGLGFGFFATAACLSASSGLIYGCRFGF
jgi:hypothetical protein